MGLNVSSLESDHELQDAALSLHHACMLTFSETPAIKIIENHNGVAFIKIVGRQILIQGQQGANQEIESGPQVPAQLNRLVPMPD